MRTGIPLGRLFGINLRIDWSWFLIFILITWNLALGFGGMHPDWTIWLTIGLALLASLLFFGSVLAHEMAHSLVARAQGLPVRNITLFLFGGVSNIQREPPSPRAEFLITIVGPITSIALGFLFAWFASLDIGSFEAAMADPVEAAAQLSPTATLFLWLGSINILLGLFNLIPGFPLDGGRILRSILWAITDDLRRATRWAAGVGQAVAWTLILLGVAMVFGVTVPFFGTGFLGGIWLVFIGWFLSNAASQSYQQVVVRDILEDVPVARLMRTDPPAVAPEESVAGLVHDYVMRTDDHAFPVLDHGRLVGLVTLDDIRPLDRDGWDGTTVGQVMTPTQELTVVTPEEDAAEALTRLTQLDVRQLPVMRNGELVGLLRRRDIVRWLHVHGQGA